MPLSLTATLNDLHRLEQLVSQRVGSIASELTAITISDCGCEGCQMQRYGTSVPADHDGLVVRLSCLNGTAGPTYQDLFPADQDEGRDLHHSPLGPNADQMATGLGTAALQHLKQQLASR